MDKIDATGKEHSPQPKKQQAQKFVFTGDFYQIFKTHNPSSV